MKKGKKAAVCCVAGLIAAGSTVLAVQAAGPFTSVSISAGITTVLNEAYEESLEKIVEEVQADVEETAAEEEAAAEEVTEETAEESEYADLAIAQVTNYVNIRDTSSEEGEVLGKLYNNSAATVHGEENGWYQITSGSVTGYVKAEFVATGSEAERLAEEVGHRVAQVNTTTLKVREDAGMDATVLTLVPIEEEMDVQEDQGEWVKVSLDADVVGYVSKEFVELRTDFVQAESVEEEAARLAKEEAERQAAIEAAKKADEAAKQSSSASSSSSESSSSEGSSSESSSSDSGSESAPASTSTSGSRQALVSYALQFVGNPYSYGGTSLTGGADCSGFTMSVFANNGVSIPRDSRSQAAGGTDVSLGNVQPGDLIFYSNGGSINHVALYIGNGQVVHASTEATGIKISNMNYRTPAKAVSYLG